MDKKSIGSFIAALRKVNGMTQKDLAIKLNVSDKTVSRWERDEGVPDLSLIPVIAEIFGVTSDELLRGERKSAEFLCSVDEHKQRIKNEKQIKNLLTRSLSMFWNRSWLAVGMVLAGLLGAMICNFGFNRAYIGFLVGSIFYITAMICEIIFINVSFTSVSDEEFEGEELNRFKRSVVLYANKVLSLAVILMASSLPLIVVPFDTYQGLTGTSWLRWGFVFGIVSAAICFILFTFVIDPALIKKGVYSLDERAGNIFWSNYKLKKKCMLVLAVIMLLTLFGQCFILSEPTIFVRGTIFDNYEDFKAYMEQNVTGKDNIMGSLSLEAVYYDETGNRISEDAALSRTLTDKDGNVVCEYIGRNESVAAIRYGAKNLPITVYTTSDMREAHEIVGILMSLFLFLYLLEIVTTILVYNSKRLV